jgi:hypothetical protein
METNEQTDKPDTSQQNLIHILSTIQIKHLSSQQSKHILYVSFIRNRLTFELSNQTIPVNIFNYQIIIENLLKIHSSTAKLHMYSDIEAYKILCPINHLTYKTYLNMIIHSSAKVIVSFN